MIYQFFDVGYFVLLFLIDKDMKKWEIYINFSDIHYFHKNIFKYSAWTDLRDRSYIDWNLEESNYHMHLLLVNSLENAYNIIYNEILNNWLNEIKIFLMNLWDYIFNLSQTKLNKFKELIRKSKNDKNKWTILEEFYKLNERLRIEILKQQDIFILSEYSYFIYWNHDNFTGVTNELLFDKNYKKDKYDNYVFFFEKSIIDNNWNKIRFFWTHYPLFWHISRYSIQWNDFIKVNENIIDNIISNNNLETTYTYNIHWHIHNNPICEKIKEVGIKNNIQFINVSVDKK